MAFFFNEKHKPPFFKDKVFIRLIKAGKRGYQLLRSSKLSIIRMGLYLIRRRVN